MSRVLLILVALLVSACASTPRPVADDLRTGTQPVAVVPFPDAPAVNLRAFTAGRRQVGAWPVSSDAASGPAEAFVAPYVALAATPAGTGVGVSSGKAIDEKRLAAGERAAAHAAAKMEPARALAAQVATALGADADVELTADVSHAASVVRVSAKEMGFESGQYASDLMSLVLVIEARWVRRDGTTLYQRPYVYRSSERNAAAWTPEAAAAELAIAYQTLGEKVTEDLYLRSPTLSPGAGSACGPQWIAPERLYRPGVGKAPTEWNRFIVVDSLKPRLAWEPLAETLTRAGAPAEGIKNVRYDVRVWRARADGGPVLVYERRDLEETEHVLDTPLAAQTNYFWSVRARFTSGEGTRATVWGRFRLPYANAAATGGGRPEFGLTSVNHVRDACSLDFIPEANFYRFRTP